MVRAFVAVDVPREVREGLAEIVGRLQAEGVSGVRWTRPEGIHLTLKFLGEIDPGTVEKILEQIERATEGVSPFSLALSGVGAFPRPDSPRVIWVGLKGDLDSLEELQRRIDHEISLLGGGFAKEGRPFTPHLTLGRLRQGVSVEERGRLGKGLSRVALEGEVRWEVREVGLIRSTLNPAGAVYEVLGLRHLYPGSRG